VICQHHTVDHDALKERLGQSFGALYAHIEASGVAPAGPPFVIYGRASEPGVRWEIDVCAPIATALSSTADIKFQEMPEERIVSVIHFGPYETLGDAYKTIDSFIEENGYVASSPPREIYLSEPDVPPELIQTLIEQPIF
jgi:effector-binding domain-containing protein